MTFLMIFRLEPDPPTLSRGEYYRDLRLQVAPDATIPIFVSDGQGDIELVSLASLEGTSSPAFIYIGLPLTQYNQFVGIWGAFFTNYTLFQR